MSPGRLVFPYYLQKKLKNYLKKRIVQPPAPVLIASHGEARYPSLWCRLALQTPFETILFSAFACRFLSPGQVYFTFTTRGFIFIIGIPVYDCSGLFIKISQN